MPREPPVRAAECELGVDLKELRIDVFERLRAGRCLGANNSKCPEIDLWIVDPRQRGSVHC